MGQSETTLSSKSIFDSDQIKHSYKEVIKNKKTNQIQRIEHEGILKIRQLPFRNSVQISNSPPLFLQISNSSLADLLQQRYNTTKLFTQQDIIRLCESLIYTLTFLQNKNIVYTDLSTENIFYDSENGTFKLLPTDLIKQSAYELAYNRKRFSYLSPQLIIALRYHQKHIEPELFHKSNVFSLGMILLEVTSLKSSKQCYDEQSYDILDSIISERLQSLYQYYPEKIINFIAMMLNYDFTERKDLTRLSLELNKQLSQRKFQNQKLNKLNFVNNFPPSTPSSQSNASNLSKSRRNPQVKQKRVTSVSPQKNVKSNNPNPKNQQNANSQNNQYQLSNQTPFSMQANQKINNKQSPHLKSSQYQDQYMNYKKQDQQQNNNQSYPSDFISQQEENYVANNNNNHQFGKNSQFLANRNQSPKLYQQNVRGNTSYSNNTEKTPQKYKKQGYFQHQNYQKPNNKVIQKSSPLRQPSPVKQQYPDQKKKESFINDQQVENIQKFDAYPQQATNFQNKNQYTGVQKKKSVKYPFQESNQLAGDERSRYYSPYRDNLKPQASRNYNKDQEMTTKQNDKESISDSSISKIKQQIEKSRRLILEFQKSSGVTQKNIKR